MTVIYAETHLTSDPIFQQDTAIFSIALSTISVQCHIHRDENINYIRNNQIRTGDLIRLHGIFMTTQTDVHYIKISSLSLMTSLKLGKKRKIDVMKGDPIQLWDDQSSSDSTYSTSRNKSVSPQNKSRTERPSLTDIEGGLYIEAEGCFSNYFFMLLGKVQFVCQQVHNFQYQHQKELIGEINRQLVKCQSDNINLLNGILQQIYTMYTELTQHELNKLGVLNFVITVKSLVDKMCELLTSCNYVIPQALVIDRRIPLPSFIYNYHINSYN
jgi:hypothetical protein